MSAIKIPVLALLLTVALTVYWKVTDFGFIEAKSSWIILSYLLLLCLAFPIRYAIYAIVALLIFFGIISEINEIKIALTQLPVTYMDFAIIIAHPMGFLRTIGVSHFSGYVFLFVAGALSLIILGIVGRFTIKLFRGDFRTSELTLRFVTFLVCLAALWNFTVYFVAQEQISVAAQKHWSPKHLTKLSRKIGLIPFLAFSSSIAHADTGDYFDGRRGIELPDNQATLDATNLYVRPVPTTPENLPNIIVVLGESTFDINQTFKLNIPVKNAIFSKNDYTQALGKLRVNAIGGGSWITEFETITGVDSRLFGYSGYYTHSSVAPFISSTFITYLSEHGYKTHAFYPTTGHFYNARNAYKAYGVKQFYDNVDLGRGESWSKSDLEIVDDSIKTLGQNPASPFYAFVVTNQNHAPHPCKHFEHKREFVSSLRDNDDFAINCELNEYISRLQETAAAFEKLLNYLKEIEVKTSRPFVLLLFGDHQPHTFTQDLSVTRAWSRHDYSPYRTAPKGETVFHLASSKPGIVSCCEGDPPPATLLPSLLSAFVASRPHDVYLGVNFLIYRQCGSDFLHGAETRGIKGYTGMPGSRTPECEEAYDGALAYYRQFGPLSRYTNAAQ